MTMNDDVTPTRQQPSKPLFYHTSSPYRGHASTSAQRRSPQTAPWRETVGGPLGELLRAAASSPQHDNGNMQPHTMHAAHPASPRIQQHDPPQPTCSASYTKEGMHLQQIAQLKHQLQVALQQRDDAARAHAQQQADWEVAQHAQHEQTRQQLLQLQQQADANHIPAHPNIPTTGHHAATTTLQHQLDQCIAQRDDAQRQVSTLESQLQEQSTFVDHVLTRFQSAIAAVQHMEQHCAAADARIATQQQEMQRRLEEEGGRHAQVVEAMQLQYEGELQHAALRLDTAVQEAHKAGQQAVRQVQDKASLEVHRLTRELEALRNAQAGVVVEYEGRLSRMVKHASDSQRALEQRCAGLVEAVEGKTAALKVAQQQAAEYASEVERLRRKMKKCVAAIKALEHGRQQLEAAVQQSTTTHHHLESTAAAHKAQHDAKDAMLQTAVHTAAALHQRLAVVERKLAQQRGVVAAAKKAQIMGPCVPIEGIASMDDRQSSSSPRIAAVHASQGASQGVSQRNEVLGGADVVCENPLFASTRPPSSLVSVGWGGTTASQAMECASPASRAASATLSNIALKLQELQRHLQSTPPVL